MLPRPEYPRPQFVREDWLNLNGEWAFDFDDTNKGLAECWFDDAPLRQKITVPFAFQSPLSGIGNNDFHDVVWYQKTFELPSAWQGKKLMLHFGAVDYRAWVWVNGIFAGFHEGGHTPFALEISRFVQGQSNSIVLRVEDLSEDIYQPRGKQYWKRDSASIFYTRTTGIWQTVWLEPLGESYIANLQILPDIDSGRVQLDYELAGDLSSPLELEAAISFGGKELVRSKLSNEESPVYLQELIQLGAKFELWSPESPNLYELALSLKRDGQVVDSVSSYFGMRKISIENGQVCLNNQPYQMRLVLDQGYHPTGILTFPTDEDFKKDIELTKALGFNGVRKHQKIEDPRFLYWADQMGLLVWGEIANAYAFSSEYVKRISAEWQEAVRRDYNHPCIVAWTPMNESWGVPNLPQSQKQIDHLASLYHLTKSLDTSRLVISNDGWEHARTDLLTIHDYEASGQVLTDRYASLESTISARPANRDLYVKGYAHEGQPILLTEFGGVAYRMSKQEGWGYSTASDEADFLKRLAEIMDAVYASPVLQGFCYTQITDVEQEINGLLTYDREPKAALETIAKLIKGQK
jgi:beta-galactosidase/beta-glucuronidase